ncbi:hypothetical protein GCM10011491_37920 [Brucella endophytica]|uniref:Tlde1 domain-containing protein n=1 Tax=Brucella endophytica TaxID=1963359 RepID=A0A916SM77_9HYPH|nr:DUF2778 domain-containing protein [Brucella endophytica]GGB06241.1 hypothetical protein GCM10011491_37920 [Brucella endophytica]
MVSGGAALASATLWSVTAMMAVSNPVTTGSNHFLPRLQLSSVNSTKARPLDGEARSALAKKLLAEAETAVAMMSSVVSDDKSARALKRADPVLLAAAPAAERFGSRSAGSSSAQQRMTAYAAPIQSGAARAALAAMLPPVRDGLTMDEAAETETAEAPDTDDADLPDDVPLPQFRPPNGEDRKPASERARAIARQADPRVDRDNDRETQKPQLMAFARPDNPQKGGIGQAFRDMFGSRPKAGNGIAVYDISAAKVYMPDGSVLEAHSGIGKMADNPRYVHVKMNGPTPPHTYNLRMRESRFHGVEAIRMLPVDGKNKYGRDGFLTHSYLLRGGRAESHGCVAFRDYDRFLKAFKQGKVKQMIVVPGNGAATVRMVSGRGRGA